MNLTAQHVVCRSSRLAERLFEQSQLVITVDDSILHRFNESATFLWQELATPKTINALCAALGGHFDECTAEEVRPDVLRFVDACERKGLVSVSRPLTDQDFPEKKAGLP